MGKAERNGFALAAAVLASLLGSVALHRPDVERAPAAIAMFVAVPVAFLLGRIWLLILGGCC